MQYNPDLPRSEENHPEERYTDKGESQDVLRDIAGTCYRLVRDKLMDAFFKHHDRFTQKPGMRKSDGQDIERAVQHSLYAQSRAAKTEVEYFRHPSLWEVGGEIGQSEEDFIKALWGVAAYLKQCNISSPHLHAALSISVEDRENFLKKIKRGGKATYKFPLLLPNAPGIYLVIRFEGTHRRYSLESDDSSSDIPADVSERFNQLLRDEVVENTQAEHLIKS